MKEKTTITCENIYINENEKVRAEVFNTLIAMIINLQIQQVPK
jgi:hypothetical protein